MAFANPAQYRTASRRSIAQVQQTLCWLLDLSIGIFGVSQGDGRFTIPPNAPAKQFWSLIVYDVDKRSI